VTLVSGSMSVHAPTGPVVQHIESTEQMADAVGKLLKATDVLIMAAAPADFRPANAATTKIKKGKKAPSIAMANTPDILRSTASKRKKGSVIVGFALETNDALAHGAAKLKEKSLDMIVINDATEPGAGFGVDTNRVTLLQRGGKPEALPLLTKDEVADAILDRVERLL
jgi:phosphopantothenoylcysteine decarboxylase/phosphopantothenate--cysteine ligase